MHKNSLHTHTSSTCKNTYILLFTLPNTSPHPPSHPHTSPYTITHLTLLHILTPLLTLLHTLTLLLTPSHSSSLSFTSALLLTLLHILTPLLTLLHITPSLLTLLHTLTSSYPSSTPSHPHFHTMAFSPVLCLAFPLRVTILTPLVLGGIGIRTSTF